MSLRSEVQLPPAARGAKSLSETPLKFPFLSIALLRTAGLSLSLSPRLTLNPSNETTRLCLAQTPPSNQLPGSQPSTPHNREKDRKTKQNALRQKPKRPLQKPPRRARSETAQGVAPGRRRWEAGAQGGRHCESRCPAGCSSGLDADQWAARARQQKAGEEDGEEAWVRVEEEDGAGGGCGDGGG